MIKYVFPLAAAAAGLLLGSTLEAQRTLSFTNTHGEHQFPVAGPDGPLGKEYSAQLQLGDGTKIGDPIALENGFFASEPMPIPEGLQDEIVHLQAVIRDSNQVVVTKTRFTSLVLRPNESINSRLLFGSIWLPLQDKRLGYRVLDNRQLELSWPLEFELFESDNLNDGSGNRIREHQQSNGRNVKVVPLDQQQRFYWLDYRRR